MPSAYQEDLAYIHATAYGGLARGAAPEIVRLLRNSALPIHRVVDLGCGAGPLTAALARAGFETTGIDGSAALLAMARLAVPQARFLQGSVYDVDLPECEAMVAIGEVLCYHDELDRAGERVFEFFRRAADLLPAGGRLIFDAIESGDPPLTGRGWNSGNDWAVLVETEENRDEGTLIRTIETFRRSGEVYRRGREVHKIRVFDRNELLDGLAASGFKTQTALSYGTQKLAPRRRAFFATRIR